MFKKSKRLISALLVAIMFLTAIPFTAVAENSVTGVEFIDEIYETGEMLFTNSTPVSFSSFSTAPITATNNIMSSPTVALAHFDTANAILPSYSYDEYYFTVPTARTYLAQFESNNPDLRAILCIVDNGGLYPTNVQLANGNIFAFDIPVGSWGWVVMPLTGFSGGLYRLYGNGSNPDGITNIGFNNDLSTVSGWKSGVQYINGTAQNGSVTITFNVNGGDGFNTSQTKTSGQQFGTLPEPTRAGHNFVGWYTATTGGTRIFTSTLVPTQNTTYYARWEQQSNVVIITFNVNGGNGSNTTITRTPGQILGTLPTPTRSGHTFMGWYTTSTAGQEVFSHTQAPSQNTTYFAAWGQSSSRTLSHSGTMMAEGMAGAPAISNDIIFNGSAIPAGAKVQSISINSGSFTMSGTITISSLQISSSESVGTLSIPWSGANNSVLNNTDFFKNSNARATYTMRFTGTVIGHVPGINMPPLVIPDSPAVRGYNNVKLTVNYLARV